MYALNPKRRYQILGDDLSDRLEHTATSALAAFFGGPNASNATAGALARAGAVGGVLGLVVGGLMVYAVIRAR